ncbi:hypothetical protein EP7_001440 [Isosphaeraceae bacterium EP7]
MSWLRTSRASRVGRCALVFTLMAGAVAIQVAPAKAQMGGQFPGIYNPAYSSGFNYGSWGGSGVGLGGMGFGGMGYPGMGFGGLGFGGMGFGGLGMGYYGGLGFGGMGMTAYDQAMVKQQFSALNASNLNLQNAQAAAAYQQANFYRQQAENLALANAQKARGLQPKYQTRSGSISTLAAEDAAQAAAAPAPASPPTPRFLATDGSVLWPDFAIKNKDRADVDKAVAKVVSEQKTGGHASVASVTLAKQKLREYGHPALRLDRVQSRPKLVKDLARFLNTLNDYLSDAADDAKKADAPG